MYFGAWYKSLYASSDHFSGYAAWILAGLEYEIALSKTDRLTQWDEVYSNSIYSLIDKMEKISTELN
jgi:N-acetylated-alpha-linked acidic dipeptidase